MMMIIMIALLFFCFIKKESITVDTKRAMSSSAETKEMVPLTVLYNKYILAVY